MTVGKSSLTNPLAVDATAVRPVKHAPRCTGAGGVVPLVLQGYGCWTLACGVGGRSGGDWAVIWRRRVPCSTPCLPARRERRATSDRVRQYRRGNGKGKEGAGESEGLDRTELESIKRVFERLDRKNSGASCVRLAPFVVGVGCRTASAVRQLY